MFRASCIVRVEKPSSKALAFTFAHIAPGTRIQARGQAHKQCVLHQILDIGAAAAEPECERVQFAIGRQIHPAILASAGRTRALLYNFSPIASHSL
jgi:hypothetical protein